jgi:glycosyltransferase involved in cell wall biosynthesis
VISDSPRVSVVVPTRARPERLARLIEALRAQTLAAEDFEVIVVADGASAAALAGLAGNRDGMRLEVLTHPASRGPAAARNTGWRRARAPLIAFTDDDCAPAPGWLEAGLAASSPLSFVQGPTRADPSEGDRAGVRSRTVAVGSCGPQYETCNIFYPRAVLEALGGFDEAYGLAPGGEDTDLGWRAVKRGFAPVWAQDAVVHHAVEPLGTVGMLRVAARWSGPMRVFAAHREARSMLYRGVFWNVWHYLIWRSLASLLAPAWLRRMLLTLHLLALRRRALAERGGGRDVPFLLVHDLVECWAVARGAIRHRTLVL